MHFDAHPFLLISMSMEMLDKRNLCYYIGGVADLESKYECKPGILREFNCYKRFRS